MKNTFILLIAFITQQYMVAQTGNVGIGTTNPVAKLDVIGSIKITDGTQGTDKVLTSDQNGKAMWKSLESFPSSGESGDYFPAVWICCNPWMTKNLDVTTYRNGEPIPKVTTGWANLTTGAYCYYNNDSTTYAAVYGKLYNGYAIKDPRGLAPEGWHLPSEIEWNTLSNCLGGNNYAGGSMKETGTAHWTNGNIGATDFSNFSALPGGQRTQGGVFKDIGVFGYWWSATNVNTTNGFGRSVNAYDSSLLGISSDLNAGYSVRCLKD